jgi:hypothetical protein
MPPIGQLEAPARPPASTEQLTERDLERLRAELPPPGRPFHASFILQGREYTCEHGHRTQQAAVECAKRMSREMSRQLGLEVPSFEHGREGEAEPSPVWPPPS